MCVLPAPSLPWIDEQQEMEAVERSSDWLSGVSVGHAVSGWWGTRKDLEFLSKK